MNILRRQYAARQGAEGTATGTVPDAGPIEGFFATIMVEILEHRANDGAGILKDFSEKVAAHARRFKAKTRDPELQKQFDEIAERTIANANERGVDELFRRTMK